MAGERGRGEVDAMVEISYRRHRFPPVVIQHAVWLYLRFTLSYRDVEDLLVERGLDFSYETADPAAPRLGNDRNAHLRWLSVRLTLAPRLRSILDTFSSKLRSRRRRRIDEILALAYAGHVK